MHGRFDALVTMDRKLPGQQKLSAYSFGVVLVEAPSNRMVHLRPLVPGIVAALDGISPGKLERVGASQAFEPGIMGSVWTHRRGDGSPALNVPA